MKQTVNIFFFLFILMRTIYKLRMYGETVRRDSLKAFICISIFEDKK